MNMNIQHRNGAARILHFLYGRGGSGAHLNEIAEACGLSY
jgi:hypothetical protein